MLQISAVSYKDLKKCELASVRSSAWGNDCSKETLIYPGLTDLNHDLSQAIKIMI